jgi:methanol metabolism-related c-type cytochrome
LGSARFIARRSFHAAQVAAALFETSLRDCFVRRAGPLQACLGALCLLAALQALAQASKTEKDGKWETADGSPTYNIAADGTVDWYTYSGFRRYHSECHVCHGPEGEGSTYAPALIDSMKTTSYPDFMQVVASGRQSVGAARQSVMPALGDNPNVMCYIDDIYVYLKARAEGGLPRGRPAKRAEKPAAADQHEKACFGTK